MAANLTPMDFPSESPPMEIQKDILIKIGRQVVESAHQHFRDYYLDNAEYIPMLKGLIKGLEKLADQTSSLPTGAQIGQELRDYGHRLFVDLWLQHAAEDDDAEDIKIEKKKASKTFNEIFDRC